MPPRVASVLPLLLSLLAAMAAVPAAAQDWRPGGAFLAEGGVSVHGTTMLAAGASWPWRWQSQGRGGSWSGATEAWIAHWSAREDGGPRSGFTQVAISPMLRWRFGGGASPWFAEAGIGLSLNDRLYRREHKQFSTRLNFVDSFGVGYSFGPSSAHEIGLRLMHVSNAGFRKPNPGENFVLLRYARSF